jgi:flagellar basal-body rod modification protein FlgD
VPTSAISPIGSSGSASTTPIATASTAGPQLDRDTFLKLLVAQLKYQDPSKPTDASTFITQSSQLAVVDKLDALNTSMERAALSSRFDTAAAIVGRTVAYALPSGVVTSGEVSAVRFDGTETIVEVGGVSLPLQSVLGVMPTPTATTSTVTPPASTTTTPAAAPTTTPADSTGNAPSTPPVTAAALSFLPQANNPF